MHPNFVKRPSGARTFLGESFIKIGPDCLREAELLQLASDFCPAVWASSKDFMVLEPVQATKPSVHSHIKTLKELHNSGIRNPSWRLYGSHEDYRAYCLHPSSDRVPRRFYQIIHEETPNRVAPVFIHGDATLSNGLFNGDRTIFIDLSIRPTAGDPLQDWTKLFFSCVLGFDHSPMDPLSVPEFAMYLNPDSVITDLNFAYHLVCNIVRVLRKEPLSNDLMTRAFYHLKAFL